MKKLIPFIICAVLISCGDANDGDARTDTTNLIIDTGGMESPDDTARHVNTNSGQYPRDTVKQGKSDVRSSSPTSPASRSTTSGSDTGRRQ